MTKDEFVRVNELCAEHGMEHTFIDHSKFEDVKDPSFHFLRSEFVFAWERLNDFLENQSVKHGK